ncbi:MAG TPA: hypothetical protein VMW24_12055 [Sedimentisphaerales bacterium]|nr:hypothetical protein [Sedimentisphaerales bacterium]
MLRSVMRLSVVALICVWAVAPAESASIAIENASFESPVVDPNGWGAFPVVEGWIEIDLDTLGSTNTGVFLNTPADSFDHVVNADGRQLAFLGSELGNGLEQDLAATYKSGCDYRLTMGVGISSRFPPRAEPPGDTLNLVLYYLDGNTPVDIVSQSVEAGGVSSTQLQDVSVYLQTVNCNDAWAGKNIGVAIRAAGQAGGFWDMDNVRLVESLPVSIGIANASFESPAIDLSANPFGAVPEANDWIEMDLDMFASSNTGVFANTEPNSFDHVINAEGRQLAFLASALGNGFEQDLGAAYKTGCDYRLTVGVGISSRFPPRVEPPVDTLNLVLYYLDGNTPVDIASQSVEAVGISSTQLQDFSLYLPAVDSNDAWAGKSIGVAIRAAGQAGGFWDLDNVRLVESLPVSIAIANASFESPLVDPNGWGAFPVAEGWIETDLDTLASTNTGVFLNTPPDSFDHVVNADGRQLAFLGSASGNGFEQDLGATYKTGCNYRLTVGVGISSRFPPSAGVPADSLELVLYYLDGGTPVDIASQTIDAGGPSATQLQDFSVYLPTVNSNDAWAGKSIGVAIRAAGQAGGFWDLDNVRLGGSLPAKE